MHIDDSIMFTNTVGARVGVSQGGAKTDAKSVVSTAGDRFGSGAGRITPTSGGVNSTNVVDMQDTGTILYLERGGFGIKINRRMGMIENFPFAVLLREAIVGGALTIELVEAATEALTGGTLNVLYAATIATADTPENYLWPVQILPRPITQRYIGLKYKGTGITAGRIEAGVLAGVDGSFRG